MGTSVCRYLSCFGFDVYAFSRRPFPVCSSITPLILPTIAALSSRIDLLSRFDAVVHLAGRAHIMNDNSANPLAEFRRVNVFETELLAEACSVAGLRRFVFISSIKVNGEISDPSVPFTSQAPPCPSDPYALSKLEAEISLVNISSKTNLEYTIIRPPLIYGPMVKGNLASVLRLVEAQIPLPFGNLTFNRRSLISVYNLSDFIRVSLLNSSASNKVFLVSDNEISSTAELFTRIGKAINKPVRLFSVPLTRWAAVSLSVLMLLGSA